jgi:AraC family transcriptional regulator
MQSKPLHQLARPTLEEWYARPFIQVLNSSENLDWDGIQLRYTYLFPAADYQRMPQTEQYSLIMILDGPTRLKAQVTSEKPFDELILPGATHLITPEFEGAGMHDSTSATAFIELSSNLIPILADDAFRGDPYHVQLKSQLNFRDSFLGILIETLCSELNYSNPSGTLYAESIGQTIMLHLLRTYTNLTRISTTRQHRLTAGQIRLMNDYIDAHLNEKISLKGLAVLLYISVSHFERIFRNTFGKPPYQYVIERRVDRAKHLLSSQTLPLHDVARLCGFANQSHLTRHFTRIVGVTPGRYARYSSQ